MVIHLSLLYMYIFKSIFASNKFICYAPIPEAVRLPLGNVSITWRLLFLLPTKWVFSASQMPFLRGADGPALHIKGRAGNQSGDRGSYHWAQLPAFVWHPHGVQIWYLGSRRAFSPLTLAQHLNRKLDASRGFAVLVLWAGRTCLDALLLSRLMSIPERLRWWRLQPGMSSS